MSVNKERYVSSKEVLNHACKLNEYVDAAANKQTRLYSSSIQDYAEVRSLLLDCISKIDKLAGFSDCENISSIHLPNPGQIVSIYFQHIQELDVNLLDMEDPFKSCALSVTRWFKYRFSKKSIQAGFRYNVENISDWIDCLIIAYSYYAVANKVSEFSDMLDKWAQTLYDKDAKQYPLFAAAYAEGNKLENISPEAVVLEHAIKKSLYNVDFYNDKAQSIFNRYRAINGDLSYDEISNLSTIKE